MGKKLFVGNLPFSITEQDLGDAFAQYGTVDSVKIIVDRMSGRSKGFGFVEMANDPEAVTAIEKLNGAQIEGRAISVNEARPMEARPPRGDFGGGRGPRGPGGGGGRGGNRDFGGGGRGGFGGRR